jgi:hypothetical protein
MPKYKWIPGAGITGRYRDLRTGRWLDPKIVRRELDAYIAKSGDATKALAEQLRAGNINLADWQTAMREQIKLTQLNAQATAVGGYANMTPADYGRAGQIIRQQYGYLQNFAQEIASGAQRLDGILARRAELYIKNGRRTYYDAVEPAAIEAGATHIRSRLNPADHCPECVFFDGKWFVIGSELWVPVGLRECRGNCKCSEEYGVEQADGEIKAIGI